LNIRNPTKAYLLRSAASDDKEAEYWEAKGNSSMATHKRELAARQRERAANWSLLGYLIRAFGP
jgi:hypothetical protein